MKDKMNKIKLIYAATFIMIFSQLALPTYKINNTNVTNFITKEKLIFKKISGNLSEITAIEVLKNPEDY